MFREVPIGQVDIGKQGLGLLVNAPSDDAHLCCISKSPACALYFVLLARSVNEVMTCLAQSDEIGRRITPCFP